MFNIDPLVKYYTNSNGFEYNCPSPKPNITSLVNPCKPKSPARLFSEDQCCYGSRFIGPPKLMLCLFMCVGQVCKYGNKQPTMFYIVMYRTKNRRRQWRTSLIAAVFAPSLFLVLHITIFYVLYVCCHIYKPALHPEVITL